LVAPFSFQLSSLPNPPESRFREASTVDELGAECNVCCMLVPSMFSVCCFFSRLLGERQLCFCSFGVLCAVKSRCTSTDPHVCAFETYAMGIRMESTTLHFWTFSIFKRRSRVMKNIHFISARKKNKQTRETKYFSVVPETKKNNNANRRPDFRWIKTLLTPFQLYANFSHMILIHRASSGRKDKPFFFVGLAFS
jgi:hypothetical protein